MPDLLDFSSRTPRYSLPLLFAGQAQKEFYVNEALSTVDLLLHPAVNGVAITPPDSPQQGECWVVGDNSSGLWAGHGGEIASFQNGLWLFAAPREGMRVLDRSSGQDLHFRSGWQRAQMPDAVAGGQTVDVEARKAIGQLIAALVAAGILPDS